MTRKSKRELERALERMEERYAPDDPADATAPEEWVSRYLERRMRSGEIQITHRVVPTDADVAPEDFDIDIESDTDRSEQVLIVGGEDVSGADVWAPAEDIPDWIDPEEDLPA